jgi:hypothetical protein
MLHKLPLKITVLIRSPVNIYVFAYEVKYTES